MSSMNTSWQGFDPLEYLIVFGASYCQTNLPPAFRDSQPNPTLEEPLGIPFPGITYNEPDLPNWVGHIVNRKPGRKVLVWNYAVGGATTQGVVAQVQTQFVGDTSKPFSTPKASVFRTVTSRLQGLSSNPAPADQYKKALFALFVGINDVCFDINVEETVAKLFKDSVEPLYLYGARNFVIFDNPPRMRKSGPIVNPSPGFIQHNAKIDRWNAALGFEIEQFMQRRKNATVFRFPTHELFTDIFDHPDKHGFDVSDVNRARGGKIWMDGLHPTSRVHEIIADRLIALLS